MEMRQLRYFVAVGQEGHYGRAARQLRVAQPALSRQIQKLEEEIGFKLFERLPRGVKITDAGKRFLDDARRTLLEINDATERAKRVAFGQSGTLRVGYVENISWQGIVPDSLRVFRENQPDAALQLKALKSLDQIAAIQSGSLDVGYATPLANPKHGLAHFQVGTINTVLALSKGHALTKLKKLRLRDLVDVPFVAFPKWAIPNVHDRLMNACARGGLKEPRIVQETPNETTLLSLVQCRVGVAFVSSASRWRCPPGVVLLPVSDLKVSFSVSLMWRRNDNSPLLMKFVADVRALVEQRDCNSEVLG